MCFYFLQKKNSKNETRAEVMSGCLHAGMCCLGAGKHLPIVYSDGHFQFNGFFFFFLEAIQAVRIMLGYEVQEGLGRWP